MPRQTFLNLPEEKRRAFIDIALEEFANNDYNTASISKIVEKAGIAKGSVYQYFEDKQDLFLYLLDVANREMMGVIQHTPPPDPNADFFETLRWQMSVAVRASLKFPAHSRLARRAYASPLPFRDTILEKAKRIREEHFQAMVARAQASGHLDPDLDPAVVSFMVQGLMSELGSFLQAKFGKRKGDWVELPEVSDVFDQVLEVLRNGLGSKSAR
ncbi:MAG TPA: TetR/AcrR family transcriptional regulator [Anaerolineales bacterium]|jgi:AcrR family transcriptional regulator|nr:TetR/AcrR family transcriptional regulator [Anaerolineales bacterium]